MGSFTISVLWNDKGDKIKRNIMINDYSEGGLKMIDIDSFNRSLKAVWIKKCLDTENQEGWKSFFDLELRKYGGVVTLTGNPKNRHLYTQGIRSFYQRNS